MIITKNINVSANFDTGDFMGSFSICKNSDVYDNFDNCIQKSYKMSFEDFRELEMMIAATTEVFLESKGFTDNEKTA